MKGPKEAQDYKWLKANENAIKLPPVKGTYKKQLEDCEKIYIDLLNRFPIETSSYNSLPVLRKRKRNNFSNTVDSIRSLNLPTHFNDNSSTTSDQNTSQIPQIIIPASQPDGCSPISYPQSRQGSNLLPSTRGKSQSHYGDKLSTMSLDRRLGDRRNSSEIQNMDVKSNNSADVDLASGSLRRRQKITPSILCQYLRDKDVGDPRDNNKKPQNSFNNLKVNWYEIPEGTMDQVVSQVLPLWSSFGHVRPDTTQCSSYHSFPAFSEVDFDAKSTYSRGLPIRDGMDNWPNRTAIASRKSVRIDPAADEGSSVSEELLE